MESTRGPMEQDTVSCVASRPFFTEKSTFKIGVGDVLTWRVGFNSWINTNAVDRVAHGSSDDMKMYIFLESPNLGVEYVTPYNATPLFVVIVILTDLRTGGLAVDSIPHSAAHQSPGTVVALGSAPVLVSH